MTVIDTHGVHGAAATFAEVEAQAKLKLHSVEDLRATLATTEPMSSVGFPVGDSVKFKINPAWNHGIETKSGSDLVDAFVRVGKGATKEFQLTKDALLEATSVTGLPKGYVARTPANLVEPQLNYWFREGLGAKDFKLLVVNDEAAHALTRSTVTPFSNIRLLDEALDTIHARYGDDAEVLVDYKNHHSLRSTAFRLIVPSESRILTDTGTDNDSWSCGVQVKNSLIGESQTSIDGYLFRWWCTNGAIDTSASTGVWSRRSGGQGDEVFEWARSAVDEVLGGLDHAFDAIQAMTEISLENEVADTLRDIFQTYRVPAPQREAIIKGMVDSDQLNMYAVMQAITAAANGADVDPLHAEALMRVGGELPHVAHDRCGACRRLMPH